MGSKRVTFSIREKVYLKKLVAKYANVVGLKKTDGVSVKMKNEAWSKITDEFNRYEEHNQVTSKQLRKLWENLNWKRKRRQLDEAREKQFLSDGEPPTRDPLATGNPRYSILSGATDSFAVGTEGSTESDSEALARVRSFLYDSGTNIQSSSPELTVQVPVVDENGTPYDVTSSFQREESNLPPSHRKTKKPDDCILDEREERLKRARTMNDHQKVINNLIEEELRNKIKLSILHLEAKEQEIRQSEEAFRAEMAFKERKWKLELEILEKQVST
ncbi:hypothetical protein LSTR_LSTR007802 [Laodelphax striatellus]|uniref:Regulatory protein zeste n=1 Tax=Laodelphax striatellus TaxID=195883 RepID=A0A482WNZ8_LAOST|nr:hypothetical protein LSTR_LSTR007802 [Laodelphax striatellus]